MGLGRREFLKLTGLALAGLAIDPLSAVAVNNNAYVNKRLGILFEKPSDWGFVSVRDFGKIKDAQKLGIGLEDMDPELKAEIWEDLGDPICIATKYFEDKPEYRGVFSPTITLNITPVEELADLGHESFDELMELSREGTSFLLKDFRVTHRYEPYFKSGCKFYEYDAKYLFEHREIEEPLPVELKVLKAEHNGFYYDFNCHQSAAQNQTAHREFEAFKNSIKLI